MNYGEIKNIDTANGLGIRVSLFVAGCPRRCFNCFNPELWDYDAGEPFTEKQEEEIIQYLKPTHINGLTLLGGDPLAYCNVPALLPLLRKVKELYPNKNIWAYTGDLVENLLKEKEQNGDLEEFLSLIDVLVDGPYIEEKKDLSKNNRFKGSKNQRILDMKKTLQENKAIDYELPPILC